MLLLDQANVAYVTLILPRGLTLVQGFLDYGKLTNSDVHGIVMDTAGQLTELFEGSVVHGFCQVKEQSPVHRCHGNARVLPTAHPKYR
jgi:hypothetical protein